MFLAEFVFLNGSEWRELVFSPIIEGIAGDIIGCPRENGNRAVSIKRFCRREGGNLRRSPVNRDDNLVLRLDTPFFSGNL